MAYHLLKVFMQMIYGAWRVSKLSHPIVTIFGSAQLGQDTTYAHEAYKLAGMFVERDISVLTGGGPGIMEAANCGALAKRGKHYVASIGIGVRTLNEGKNPCVSEYFELDYFFARKYLLTHFSIAFVIFPGGFGTMDELFEILTLVQTHNMPRMPIILIGKGYWSPFIEWLSHEVLKRGAITKDALELFVVTDDLPTACSVVNAACQVQKEKK
jgi:uncharacterized protein (TIGR00730 family)